MSTPNESASSPGLQVFGVEVTLLAAGEAFTISRIACPPGTGGPPHRHGQTEFFHVLEGEMAFLADGGWRRVEAGGFLCAPPGCVHAFENRSPAPAVLLDFSAPGGHAAFFREADGLSRSGGFTPEAAAALCLRHGITLVL